MHTKIARTFLAGALAAALGPSDTAWAHRVGPAAAPESAPTEPTGQVPSGGAPPGRAPPGRAPPGRAPPGKAAKPDRESNDGPADAADLIEPEGPAPDGEQSADPLGPSVSSTLAEKPGRSFDRLLLNDAIEMALRRHPRLKMAREEIRAAETRVGQAQSQYYPRIDGWLEYLRASELGSTTAIHGLPGLSRTGGSTRGGVRWDDSFNNYFAGLILQQVVWDFGRTQGAVSATKALVMAAKVNETQVEQDVIFGVMRAFYEVRAAREAIELAEETREITLAILEYAEASRRTGLKPPSETARAEAGVAAAEVAVVRAKARLELAKALVGNALGVVGKSYEPTDRALAPGPVPGEKESIKVALGNRPELRVLDFRRDGLQQGLKSVKAQQYPRIDGRAGVNSRGQFLTGAGQDPFQRFNWNVGIIINVPIFQGLLVKKQKEEIRSRIRGVDGGQEAVRQLVILQVKQALASVRAADAAAQASEKGVKAAKAALETLQGRYQEGLAELVELTDAQNAYVRARSELVRATYDRYLSRAVLGLAMGRPRGG